MAQRPPPHLVPKSRLIVPAQEQRKQGVSGGGHGGTSSPHPNSSSVPVHCAQAGSSGQGNFGCGPSPFFMAGSSPLWGSDHNFSCRETNLHGALATVPPAAGKQGVSGGGHGGTTSPHPNSSSVPVHRAQAGSSGQGNFGCGPSPFFMAGSSPLWGSDHNFSCRESETPGEAGPSVTPGEAGQAATREEAELATAAVADPWEATAAAADPLEAELVS
ncbi:UNVERIFIED_CONTAM: hypothetical protein FKN15_043055 [Acipenser sinensis]